MYFFIFLTTNSFISYFPFPITAKLFLFLLGVAIPFILSAYSLVKYQVYAEVDFNDSILAGDKIPIIFWILLFLVVFFTRFAFLTQIPSWPLSDEGIVGNLALYPSTINHHLLMGLFQTEPMFIWLLHFFYGFFPPSLFSIRLFPAILSVASIITAYWAARSFNCRVTSWLFALLYTVSFWSIMLSRSCFAHVFAQLVELLVVGLFVRYQKANIYKRKLLYLSLMGIFIGLGFYIVNYWLTIAIALIVLMLSLPTFLKNEFLWRLFPIFLTISISFPILSERLGGINGSIWVDSYLFKENIFKTSFEYLISLFWVGLDSAPFGPIWGGLFNSVSDSFIFLGVLKIIASKSMRTYWIFFVVLICGLLPGILTSFGNMFRINAVLPIIVLLETYGVISLFILDNQLRRLHYLKFAFFLFVSLLLNLYHFAGPYSDIKKYSSEKQWRNVQYFDAYQTLEQISKNSGPLNVFLGFNPDYENKLINITCYPFNALQNPSLSGSNPRWTALITDSQYAPYFLKNFPVMKYKVLNTDKTGIYDPKPFGIFIIPTSEIPIPMLKNWIIVDEIYRNLDFQVNNKRHFESWSSFITANSSLSIYSSQDRFLNTIYWEKIGFFKFLDGHFLQSTEAYRNAIQKGIPAAHLYRVLGTCLQFQNRIDEANQCFESAKLLSNVTY